MQFNSYLFIFLFMPLFVVAYFSASRINMLLGKMVIVFSSILFYGYARYEMLIYLAISLLINYFFVLLIRAKGYKCTKIVFIPIVVNIGLLLYFKYYSFLIDNINYFCDGNFSTKNLILPLGISFYTFQQIAYAVSVVRGDVRDTNVIDYLCYILFFPKLLMGPLMEPDVFLEQLNDPRRKKLKSLNIASGIKVFSLGLLKKVLIADVFAKAVSCIYIDIQAATAMECVLLALFYTFEIYFDFSGYSDMAIGIASIINIDLPINFDSPYKAISIRDFWKKWHISLTKFLTKYVYIPLGGARNGTVKTYLNVIIVFLISGFWHGANWTFILWGLLHGVFCVIERAFGKNSTKKYKFFGWVGTFIIVSILWLLFSSPSIRDWFYMIRKIVSFEDLSISTEVINCFLTPETLLIDNLIHIAGISFDLRLCNMIVFVFIAFIICVIPDNNYRKKNTLNIGSWVLSLLCFVWGVLCLGVESTFIYSGF